MCGDSKRIGFAGGWSLKRHVVLRMAGKAACAVVVGMSGTGAVSQPIDPDNREIRRLAIDDERTLTLACGLMVPDIKDAHGFPHGGVNLARSHPCDDDRSNVLDLWRKDQFVAAWRDPSSNVVTLLRMAYPFPYNLLPNQTLPPNAYFEETRANFYYGYPVVRPEHVQDWLNYYYANGKERAEPFQAISSVTRTSDIEAGDVFLLDANQGQRHVSVFKLRLRKRLTPPTEVWFALEIRSQQELGRDEDMFATQFLRKLQVDESALLAEREFWATEPFDSYARANAVRGIRSLGGEWRAFHYGNFCLITDNPSVFSCADDGLKAQQPVISLFQTVLFPFSPSSEDAVCVISVYSTPWEFEDSVPQTRRWAGGMYLPGNDEMIMRGWSREGTVHECAHRYLRFASGKRGLSCWFDEGFACYFSSCKASGGRLVAQPVPRDHMLLAMLEAGETTIIRDVFTTNDFYLDEETQRNPKDKDTRLKIGKNYTAAWGIIYFLREAATRYPGKGYETLVPLYWETLRKADHPERATEAVLKKLNMSGFLEDFREYFSTFAEADETAGERRGRRPLVCPMEHHELLPRSSQTDFAALMFGMKAPSGGAVAPHAADQQQAHARRQTIRGARSAESGKGKMADRKSKGKPATKKEKASVMRNVASAVSVLALLWLWMSSRNGRLFVLAVLSVAGARAQTVVEVGQYTFTYRVTAQGAELGAGDVCAISPRPSGVFEVPPEIGGHTVVAIGANAFADCEELTKIKFPDSVTSIGVCAFYNCRKLTAIAIPERVSEIGLGAFFLCSSLQSVTIPKSVKVVPDWAFGRCFDLTSLQISSGVQTIGQGAFLGCDRLSAINLPESVASIGDEAFKWCSNLRTASIQGSVTELSRDLFAGCSSLQDVRLPQTVTVLHDGAFQWCSTLKRIKVPDRTTSIGSCVFYGCRSLTDIEFPTGLRDVGRAAFSGCLALKNVRFNNGFMAVGEYAFYECASLSNIFFPASLTQIRDSAFARCSGLTSMILPPNLSIMEKCAFRECVGLRSVTLPVALTEISDSAFEHCVSLSSINLPDSITVIGTSAFAGCVELQNVTFGRSLIKIGWGAFCDCQSLYKLEFPALVKHIDDRAFERCIRLTEVHFAGNAPSAGSDIYSGTSETLTSYAFLGTQGWEMNLHEEWKERPLRFQVPNRRTDQSRR